MRLLTSARVLSAPGDCRGSQTPAGSDLNQHRRIGRELRGDYRGRTPEQFRLGHVGSRSGRATEIASPSFVNDPESLTKLRSRSRSQEVIRPNLATNVTITDRISVRTT